MTRRQLVRARYGWIGWVLLGLLGGATLLVVATPTGRYLARGAWEETRILSRRRPIEAMVRDSATPPATRAKLAIVLAARAFAVDSIGLPAKESFTKFTQLDHDTLVLVLSGTRRDALVSKTWWFPVVGRVPYKGFFDFDAGKREEEKLKAEGYDTYLRPSPAFSTLGWFNDPLLSTTLGEDSLAIVQTVIHELTHNRVYLKGEAVFNESLAEFVGNRGAVEFFRSRGDTAGARVAEARWRDEMRLGEAWARAYHALDSAFAAHPYGDARALANPEREPGTRDARLAARDSVLARVRRFLVDSVGPRLETIDPSYATRVRLDNAAIVARRFYATGLGDFEAVWLRKDRSLRRALDWIVATAGAGCDPFAAVRVTDAPRP